LTLVCLFDACWFVAISPHVLRVAAATAKMAQSRLKMLQKLKPLDAVVTEASVRLTFPEIEAFSGSLIELMDVSFAYSPKHQANPEMAPQQNMISNENTVVEHANASTDRSTEPPRILFDKLNFSLDTSSRIALVGPNGVGKRLATVLQRDDWGTNKADRLFVCRIVCASSFTW